nr:MAG TPA: hypothetical protein [Caudoviricetes sp.]DAM83212.1 MAG TPA: hypothetical protein [Caudoviricetes sp.]DAO81012.1 MAG TPA: hypothetical protein [Bacteriophage sp.]
MGSIPTQFAKNHSRGFLLDHVLTPFLVFVHLLCSSAIIVHPMCSNVKLNRTLKVHKIKRHNLCTMLD